MKAVRLVRSNTVIGNFFGALGRSRETVLTSTLGYLIGKFPDHFAPTIVDPKETIHEVSVEENGEQGRHDIIVRTPKGDYLVEGKAGHVQNPRQLARYFQSRKPKFKGFILLDSGSEKATSDLQKLGRRKAVRYVTWQEVWVLLKDLTRRKKPAKNNEIAFSIAKEFRDYLEESGMAKDEIKEVYSRDLSGPTVSLFFKHGIYRSEQKWFKTAAQCQYFAPYFTANALKFDQGIQLEKGISWISRIRHIQVVEKKEISDHLKRMKVENPLQAATATLQDLNVKEAMVIILGKPFRAFQTPVQKEKLRVHGTLGARTFTFEELFAGVKKK